MTDDAAYNQILILLGEIKHRLYGENGYTGDIPEIKAQNKEICEMQEKHKERLRRLEITVVILAVLAGTSLGIDKVLAALIK